jgi:hypothetical protein
MMPAVAVDIYTVRVQLALLLPPRDETQAARDTQRMAPALQVVLRTW